MLEHSQVLVAHYGEDSYLDADADGDFGWEGTCYKHLGRHSQLAVERRQDEVVEVAFQRVVGPCALDLEVDTFAAGVAEDIDMRRDRSEVEDS